MREKQAALHKQMLKRLGVINAARWAAIWDSSLVGIWLSGGGERWFKSGLSQYTKGSCRAWFYSRNRWSFPGERSRNTPMCGLPLKSICVPGILLDLSSNGPSMGGVYRPGIPCRGTTWAGSAFGSTPAARPEVVGSNPSPPSTSQCTLGPPSFLIPDKPQPVKAAPYQRPQCNSGWAKRICACVSLFFHGRERIEIAVQQTDTVGYPY